VTDKRKILIRTLLAETGASYSTCAKYLDKHKGNYDTALAELKFGPKKKGGRRARSAEDPKA